MLKCWNSSGNSRWERLILIPAQHLAGDTHPAPLRRRIFLKGIIPQAGMGQPPEENEPGSHKDLLKKPQCYLCPLGSGVQGQIKVT